MLLLLRTQAIHSATSPAEDQMLGPGIKSTAAAGGSKVPRAQKGRAQAALVCCFLLLLAYAGRTVVRNADWVDEEQLFIAAQKVHCSGPCCNKTHALIAALPYICRHLRTRQPHAIGQDYLWSRAPPLSCVMVQCCWQE